jgi:hypothetical protein
MSDPFLSTSLLSTFDKYPEAIKRLHFDLVDWMTETLQAKIHIMYGAYVRTWANENLKLTTDRLWGVYSDISSGHETSIRKAYYGYYYLHFIRKQSWAMLPEPKLTQGNKK